MSEEKSGFTVKDRRIFAEESEEEKKEPPKQETKEEEKEEKEPQAPLPEINFATFIVSLNASALLHLGVMEDPIADYKGFIDSKLN